MAAIERTVKVLLVSRPSAGGYSRWEYRTVECRADQSGYLTERGVRIIYRSGDLYRPHASRGKGPDAYRTAQKYATEHLAKILAL